MEDDSTKEKQQKQDTIFIQIASYRDVELPKTIASAMSNARFPNKLSFGICHQYDNTTQRLIEQYEKLPNFRVVNVPYRETRGVGFARDICHRLWAGEQFTLSARSEASTASVISS
jgi:hypothetical protein